MVMVRFSASMRETKLSLNIAGRIGSLVLLPITFCFTLRAGVLEVVVRVVVYVDPIAMFRQL
jgi:hypothetical protein